MWKFVLRELTGTAIGELNNATERELYLPLNGLPTASFKIRSDHPLAARVLDGDLLLSVYEDATLRFNGDLISIEESVDDREQSIKVNAGGMLWRLTKRLIGKAPTGVTFGDPSAQLDRGEIARQVLALCNADANTGIRAGSITASSLSYVYEPPWRYKPAAEAIAELSQVMDGYDFEFDPVEPVSDGSGLWLATMNIAAALGTDRPAVAFEYGDGKRNVAGFKRSIDRAGLLNRGYNLPPAFPQTTQAVLSSSDAPSIAARGLFEGVVEGGVNAPQLRQRLVDENVRVRRFPRQIVTFTPGPNVAYVYGTDFEVGDTVRVRAKMRVGSALSERLNVAMRIYGVTFKPGDDGITTLEIDTVNEALFG